MIQLHQDIENSLKMLPFLHVLNMTIPIMGTEITILHVEPHKWHSQFNNPNLNQSKMSEQSPLIINSSVSLLQREEFSKVH